MIPIATSSVPPSSAELTRAIEDGFQRFGLAPVKAKAEGELPNLQRLEVDLSNAAATRATRLPQPGAAGTESVVAQHFALAANPLLLEEMPVQLQIRAEDAGFGLAPADGAASFLALQRARAGVIEVQIQAADLEGLIARIGSQEAGQHGVTIKEVKLDIQSTSPRDLTVRVDVGIKMMMFTAPLSLTGKIRIDDELNLHLSNLTIEGSGMAANIARGFAQPHLERAQSTPIALSVFSLGSVKLRDVECSGGRTLAVRAKFGS